MEVIAGPSTARWSLSPRVDAEVSVEPRLIGAEFYNTGSSSHSADMHNDAG